MRNEATVLRQTRENYKEARANIGEKIRQLAERPQTQSVIWQRQYQEALKRQLDTAIDALSSKNYSNISEYLNGEYEDGFIGTMYSLQKQGIPLAMPIDQRRVVKMVETGADGIKLSKRLYGNTTKLKNAVRREISIGLASGESYQDIAARLSRTMGIDYNKTVRIARTEGGRVQNGSRFDAMTRAKKNGADIVKQWDSTLDGRTRTAHRELDGQIRELEEDFEAEGQKAQHPHGFGVAWMDVNCRCVVVQRARWAIDGSNPEFEDYTKFSRYEDFDREAWIEGTLKPTAARNGGTVIDLSDARSFNEFKERYKEVTKTITATVAATEIGVEVTGETPITIDRDAEVYKTLTTEQLDKVSELVRKAPNQQAAKVYSQYESQLVLADGKYKYGAHFMPGDGVFVNVKKTFEDTKRKPMETWFHEFGHHIDYAVKGGTASPVEKFRAYKLMPKDVYVSVSYKDNLFGRTIAKEVDDLVKERQKELKAAWTRAADELDYAWMRENAGRYNDWAIDKFIEGNATSAEIKKSNWFKVRIKKNAASYSIQEELREIPLGSRAPVSDIFEGATKGGIQAGWGHGKSYWKKHDDWTGVKHSGVAIEAFAEYMECIANPEALEVLKKYLPESSKVFDEILEAISKGEI